MNILCAVVLLIFIQNFFQVQCQSGSEIFATSTAESPTLSLLLTTRTTKSLLLTTRTTTTVPFLLRPEKIIATTAVNSQDRVYFTDFFSSLQRFQDAATYCRQHYGRIASQTLNQFVSLKLQSVVPPYWGHSGSYQVLSSNASNCPAIGMKIESWTSSLLPCSSKNRFVCERPGPDQPCYSDSIVKCTSPFQNCVIGSYNKAVCKCERNYFEYVEVWTPGLICRDVDECAIRSARKRSIRSNKCTQFKGTTCVNLYGSYQCNCESGKKWQGSDGCFYSISIVQTLSISNRTVANLTSELSAVYKSKLPSVQSLVVTSSQIDRRGTTIEFDVFTTNDLVSPTTLSVVYQEEKLLNKLPAYMNSPPIAGPPVCKKQNLNFTARIPVTLPETQMGARTPSLERCPDNDGRPLGWMECSSRLLSDGNRAAYFDFNTISLTNCTKIENASSVIAELKKNATITIDTAERSIKTIYNEIKPSFYPGYFKPPPSPTNIAEAFTEIAKAVSRNEITITETTLQESVEIANKLSETMIPTSSSTGPEFSQSRTNVSLGFDVILSLETLVSRTSLVSTDSITIATDSILVNVTKIPMNWTKPNIFVGNLPLNSSSKQSLAVECWIPNSALQRSRELEDSTNSTLSTSFIFYTSTHLFPKPIDSSYEVNQVLSAQIGRNEISDLSDSLWYQMSSPSINANGNGISTTPVSGKTLQLYQCAFWNTTTNTWSTEGCSMIPGSNPPNCSCNHMTNFAVLVQTHNIPGDFALSLVGYICCSISIVGLMLMIGIYLYNPPLRSNEVNQIHIHLCICLLVVYIVFIIGVNRPREHNSCVAAAVFIHFFLLSSWGWMLAECVTMYKKFVQLFGGLGVHYVGKCSAIIYSTSAIIVIVSLSLTVGWLDKIAFLKWNAVGNNTIPFPSTYVSDRLCWLHGNCLYYSFLVPIGIVFSLNTIACGVILQAISCPQKTITAHKNKVETKDHLWRVFTLSTLLGLTWVFSIPITATDDVTTNTIFGWLFSVTNALQGFFVFILFCVRRKDVRDLWLPPLIDMAMIKDSKEDDVTVLKTSQVESTSFSNHAATNTTAISTNTSNETIDKI